MGLFKRTEKEYLYCFSLEYGTVEAFHNYHFKLQNMGMSSLYGTPTYLDPEMQTKIMQRKSLKEFISLTSRWQCNTT